jgi:hypothetical protein
MKTWIHEQWSASSHSAIRKEPAAAGGGGLGGSGEKADCKVEANETCDEQDAAGVQDGATQYLLDDGMAVDVAGVQQDDEAAITSKDTGDSMASSSAEGSKVSPVTILEGCRVHLERNSNNAPLTRLLSVPTRWVRCLSFSFFFFFFSLLITGCITELFPSFLPGVCVCVFFFQFRSGSQLQ